MTLIENILVTTDFTKSSENALENAIALAKIFKSKISLIHVLPDDIKKEKAGLFLSDAATKKMKELLEGIKSKGIKVDEPVLEYGNISDKVIKMAHNINANVIMIGAGEKAENEAFQLGTTVEKIIRKSDKPVWVIKNNSSLDIKNILCPVDFSSESSRALKNAISLSRRFKARLIIFNVYKIGYPTALGSKMDWDEENDEKSSEQLKNFNLFLKDFNLKNLNWEKEIKGGDPSAKIRKAISKYKSDLTIMGTSGKTGLSRFIMGSVTEKVIREVLSSFITLKSMDIINLKLEKKIRDIQNHFEVAHQLMEDGFYEESVFEFEICLRINDMHIPSLKGISEVYEKLENKEKSEKYKKIAKEIQFKFWDKKIEAELRDKHFKK